MFPVSMSNTNMELTQAISKIHNLVKSTFPFSLSFLGLDYGMSEFCLRVKSSKFKGINLYKAPNQLLGKNLETT